MAMTSRFKVLAAGRTDVGRRRQHNEDAFACEPELALFVVADGMGGHAAGEIASELAVKSLSDFASAFKNQPDFTWPFGVEKRLSPAENLLVNGIKLANRSVCALAQDHPEYSGMGTTIVACRIDEDRAIVGHVGDSRTYLLRGGELSLKTEDHSWVNEQVQQQLLSEEEAKNHRWRNIITRALGNRFEVEVDHTSFDLEVGDTVVLCTDGLTGPVSEGQIAEILGETLPDVEAACERLVETANEQGGPDNITVVVVHISEETSGA
jgi:protein phosphatase